MTSKLEMAFSLDPTLRGATAEIAAELQERIYREYMATTAPKVLVVGSLDNPAGAMSHSTSHRQMVPIGSGTNLESLGADALHSPPLGAPLAAAAKHASLAAAATLSMTHLWADAEAALLQATGLASAVSLMELPDPQLVAALWRLVPPMPLASSHPLLIIYTSGTSGFRPRGLVCDTGGYCSGLARTMRLAFDVRPADVVLVDASPSWITGQSYGVAGPLLCRATSVFVPPGELVDDDLPAFLAAGRPLARFNPRAPPHNPRLLSTPPLPHHHHHHHHHHTHTPPLASPLDTHAAAPCAVVLELGVTVFKASASFFKRLARHKCRLAWLRQQKLSDSLRVVTSCGNLVEKGSARLSWRLSSCELLEFSMLNASGGTLPWVPPKTPMLRLRPSGAASPSIRSFTTLHRACFAPTSSTRTGAPNMAPSAYRTHTVTPTRRYAGTRTCGQCRGCRRRSGCHSTLSHRTSSWQPSR